MTHRATYPRFLADQYYWRRKAIKAGPYIFGGMIGRWPRKVNDND